MKCVLVSFTMLLVGCTAYVPKSRIDAALENVPSSWSATPEGKAGIDTNWVRRIGGSDGELLVKQALSANPEMRITAERVKRAVAAAKITGASRKPQVQAGLSGARLQQVFVGFPFGDGGVPSSISENFGATLNVSWEPDIWGRNRARESAFIAVAQAEQNAHRAARASLAAQVLRAWLALAEANEQIALVKETGGLLQSTLEIVQDRYSRALADEGGSASQLRLAQSEISTNEALLAQRQGEREQAIRQLELLMGSYPRGAIQSAGSLPEVPPMPPAGLPSELLLRRPDVLEAERRFASSGVLVERSKTAFYPSLTITASGGTTTDTLREIFNSDFGVWSLAAGITQPIWAAGAVRAEQENLKSDERENLARLQSTVLRAFGEVEQSLVAERFLAQRELAISKAVETAIQAVQSATSEYTGGTGDALTLITAQSTRITLLTQQVTLRRLRLDNRITLHLALGGDYHLKR